MIEHLLNEEAYPHPVDDIELIETHISWILLTGKYAYKIKKPVRFDFLDYSTLERRANFCREELRLNRRFAPDVYLGVVPIYSQSGRWTLHQKGAPVECAVQMRQFPRDAMLTDELRSGRIAATQISELATRIAGIHQSAAVALWESELESSTAPVDETCGFLDLLRQNASAEALAELDHVQWWLSARHDSLEDLFHRRLQGGFVRECHGDLHTGNMFVEDGRIGIFDGIEFSHDLRWIDVASDVAFLLMDFHFQGHPRFARLFLNEYLEATGDYGMVEMLPFFILYRALVRAKIATLRAAQVESDQARADALADARRHLSLAHREIRYGAPFLWIMNGLSGSGKSTLANLLTQHYGAVRLRSDVIRRWASKDPSAEDDRPQREDKYSAANRARTYREMAALATRILTTGVPVIADATFLARPERDRFRDLADALAVPFVIVSTECDRETMERRIGHRLERQQDPSEADHRVLLQQQSSFDALGADELPLVYRIRTESDDFSDWVRQFARLHSAPQNQRAAGDL